MATADKVINFTVSAPSGPTWFQAMSDKTWATPVSNTMANIAPSSPGGTQGQVAVTRSWGGGVTNPDRKSMTIWGGGHTDYAGNEVYDLLLNVNSPAWTRPFGPTSSVQNSDTYSDGNPSSVHSGGNFAATGNFSYMTGQRGYWSQGFSNGKVWRFSHVSNAWSQIGSITGINLSDAINTGSVYDPVSGLIYFANQGGAIASINPTSGATAVVNGSEISATFDNRLAIWPAMRCLIFYRHDTNLLRILDLTNVGAGWRTCTAASAPSFSGVPGFVWHQTSRGVLGWGHTASRGNIFKLTPPNTNPSTFSQIIGTWTWSTVTPASTAVVPDSPFTGTGGGTYGRFGVITGFTATNDLAVVVNSVSSATYVYKIPTAGL